MSIITDILGREEFVTHPPVLVDIGASGGLHGPWRPLTPYAICIAFDADDRDFDARQQKSAFRQLILVNRILIDEPADQARFYLTRSPYCSSLLEPDIESLANWHFQSRFQVEKTVDLPTTTLSQVLAEHDIDSIDWFKTDSQGTDLRLFRSIGDDLIRRTLVAEFEPGFIDAYRGEDKLWQLLQYMDEQPFWMDRITVKGSERLSPGLDHHLGPLARKRLSLFLRNAPGWGEVSFINEMHQDLTLRDFLLLWVLSTLKHQHGFALQVASEGISRFSDSIFNRLQQDSRRRINSPDLQLIAKVGQWLASRFNLLRDG